MPLIAPLCVVSGTCMSMWASIHTSPSGPEPRIARATPLQVPTASEWSPPIARKNAPLSFQPAGGGREPLRGLRDGVKRRGAIAAEIFGRRFPDQVRISVTAVPAPPERGRSILAAGIARAGAAFNGDGRYSFEPNRSGAHDACSNQAMSSLLTTAIWMYGALVGLPAALGHDSRGRNYFTKLAVT